MIKYALTITLLFLLGSTTAVIAQKVNPPKTGVASYYATKFQGRKTASGELFDNAAMTAAHNTLPMGTYIKVTNLRNNKSVVVRVTDRLHAANRRIVDLSQTAAKKLGYYHWGLCKVKVEVVPKNYVDSMAVLEVTGSLMGTDLTENRID